MIPIETSGKDISLYLHIPFCTRKCHYCHFYVLPDKEMFKEHLLEGFLLEWATFKPFFRDKNIVSVYFGGGTPFLIGPERIRKILEEIQPPASAEITLEANPENITAASMTAFASVGINRVSIGIQTLDASLLEKLGRLHSPDTAINAVYDTFNAGIRNVSVDLMYDLPGQSLDSWKRTLNEAVALPITHLSLYNLTIEPHTVFFKYRNEIESQVPSDEVSLAMLLEAESSLEAAGLARYEISAFARPGFYSKHNTGYWTGRPFIGLGPSAFSYFEGERFRNIANLNRYVDCLKKGISPIDFRERLESPEKERELIALRLRLMQGIGENETLLDVETKNILETLSKDSEPLLMKSNAHYRLTEKGKLFYDEVASMII